MCVCISTPRGCNLVRGEIVCVITTNSIKVKYGSYSFLLLLLMQVKYLILVFTHSFFSISNIDSILLMRYLVVISGNGTAHRDWCVSQENMKCINKPNWKITLFWTFHFLSTLSSLMKLMKCSSSAVHSLTQFMPKNLFSTIHLQTCLKILSATN